MVHYKGLVIVSLILVLVFSCIGCLPKLDSQVSGNTVSDNKVSVQSENVTRIINLSDQEKISLITDIHQYSVRKLGWESTSNCSTFNPNISSYTFRFCAPALQIPICYFENINGPCDDEYVYLADASAATEYGKSLLNTSLSRMLFVVFHEIWHGQIEVNASVEEPMGTVIGYAAAIVYAKETFGEDTNVYQELKADFVRYLKHSDIINATWKDLYYLYGEYQTGKIPQQVALQKKQEILKAAEDTYLKEFGGYPTFKLNNASLGFNMTYTKYFPLMYQVYVRMCQDKEDDLGGLKATIEVFKAIPEIARAEDWKKMEDFLKGYLGD